MNLRDWCGKAQEEQTAGKNHLFANYRYCRQNTLITEVGLRSFETALGGIANPSLDPGDGSGASGYAVERAVTLHYRSAGGNPVETDFRFQGQPIHHEAGTLLAHVSREPVKELYMTDLTNGGDGQSITDHSERLVWLTRATDVVAVARRSKVSFGTAIEIEDLFVELVHQLGFRPLADAETYYCLKLARLNGEHRLRRPHALSTGYVEQFCAATNRAPFGETADNRTGDGGLPEAVSPNLSLVWLDADSGDYVDFKREISEFCDDIDPADGRWIDVKLRNEHIYDEDEQKRRTCGERILARLGQTGKVCPGDGCVCDAAA